MGECYQWDHEGYQWRRDRAFNEICLACNEEFWRWFTPHPGGPDSNDLIKFVAMRLKGYAKRVDDKKNIERCECFNRLGRCRNFATQRLMDRDICRFHADRINKGWNPVFGHTDQRDVWRAKVMELLYGDWDRRS